MKNTIKAKDGYKVECYKGKKTGKMFGRVFDGEHQLFIGECRTLDDYNDEKEQNECFIKYEVFTTIDGKQFIYWGDDETQADYITKVN